MRDSTICHVTSAPFHPSTNGQADRMAKTVKDTLRRLAGGNWQDWLAALLLEQHVTSHFTTGRSPVELLMNRRLTVILDRLHPDLSAEESQQVGGKVQVFHPGNQVYARNYGRGPDWVPATIAMPTGLVSYRVTMPEGQEL